MAYIVYTVLTEDYLLKEDKLYMLEEYYIFIFESHYPKNFKILQ